MEVKQPVRLHRIELSNRKTALICGVRDVKSFDEQEILLETDEELLIIRGRQLHVDRLSLEKGEVDVSGVVDSLIYTDKKNFAKSGESLIKRLFG